MDKELQKIIRKSIFSIQKGSYIYAKVSSDLNFDNCFMLSRDKDEITAVFREEKIDQFEVIERNKDLYRLIELKVSLPFYAVGFLAAVSGAIAKSGMNDLIVSTYSKDYVLVRDDCIDKARNILLDLGFTAK